MECSPNITRVKGYFPIQRRIKYDPEAAQGAAAKKEGSVRLLARCVARYRTGSMDRVSAARVSCQPQVLGKAQLDTKWR